MKKDKKNAFSLIELIVVMTILFIVSLLIYSPYLFYRQKAILKQWVKEVSKSIYEARNIAINGSTSWSWNLSIWIYFDTLNNDTITFFSYPHSFTGSQITVIPWSEVKIVKTLKLPEWTQIEKIWWQDNGLFFFSSIFWEWKYYYFDPTRQDFPLINNRIEIDITYEWATAEILKRKIFYYIWTNIIDY